MIEFDDFLMIDVRVGRILAADPFPEARKPSAIGCGSTSGRRSASG